MIKEIITNKKLLSIPCVEFKKNYKLVKDLLDTAKKHKDNCVALASNQIGGTERVFVIKNIHGNFHPIINPEIICVYKEVLSRYESCLSRPKEKPIKKRRFKKIKIKFQDIKGQWHGATLRKFPARIFQHQIDHLNGKLI